MVMGYHLRDLGANRKSCPGLLTFQGFLRWKNSRKLSQMERLGLELEGGVAKKENGSGQRHIHTHTQTFNI